ncbi:LysE family transporter [Candidatus Sulfidibacterium hydrothermale]|uniref:LysE family translocator n=1 Tax=Candidatus Sulfidibacterium hydrothermale TaxID=2875962 RepID=UPI001F0B6B2C|nr:LysE family transporter [Candidatus Sulfidibacterium hydrothermale]UBM62582.1 LysE family transporter [Candidatus Sulfidibacterium hydrothermale]
MHPLFEGMLLGLTLALFFGFGPAFFALVQTGIHRGFSKGFILAVGVFLNDLTVVSVSIMAAHAVMDNMHKHQLLGIIGGIILIIFGVLTSRHKIEVNSSDEVVNISEPHAITYLIKGYLLNIANPFVWLFWPTVVLGVAAPFMDTTKDIILFFAGTLSVVFSSDVTKVYLASKIKGYITDKFLHLINKIAAISLIVFGIALIIRSLYMAGYL